MPLFRTSIICTLIMTQAHNCLIIFKILCSMEKVNIFSLDDSSQGLELKLGDLDSSWEKCAFLLTRQLVSCVQGRLKFKQSSSGRCLCLEVLDFCLCSMEILMGTSFRSGVQQGVLARRPQFLPPPAILHLQTPLSHFLPTLSPPPSDLCIGQALAKRPLRLHSAFVGWLTCVHQLGLL